MITLVFANKSQIVINLQKPLHEVWMAAKSGGYHYKYGSNQWLSTKGEGEFFAHLSTNASQQAGQALGDEAHHFYDQIVRKLNARSDHQRLRRERSVTKGNAMDTIDYSQMNHKGFDCMGSRMNLWIDRSAGASSATATISCPSWSCRRDRPW